MTLQSSGKISATDILVEEIQPLSGGFALNDARSRALAKVLGDSTTIKYSDFYGKTAAYAATIHISSNTANFNLYNYLIGSGWDGNTVVNATIDIDPGVYIYSTSTGNAAFETGYMPPNSTVTINNSGFILGKGGDGGYGTNQYTVYSGQPGGHAINTQSNLIISSVNGYIAGGGGGGGAGAVWVSPGSTNGYAIWPGGGGAGGGNGQTSHTGAYGSNNAGNNKDFYAIGGSGATAMGTVGGGAQKHPGTAFGTGWPAGSGGGGWICPGAGGTGGQDHYFTTQLATGGGSGGGGGGQANWTIAYEVGSIGGAGGWGGGIGQPATGNGSLAGVCGGGGGGGWVAAGSAGVAYNLYTGIVNLSTAAGVGGKAINLNGYKILWPNGFNSNLILGVVL